MGATVIDGKALAAATKAEAAEKVKALKAQGINPCLAVILVGENPASQVYVRGKINDCAQCGIESRSINLPADTTQEALLAEVKTLAEDAAVHGILVQLPLPAQIDEKAVIDAIPPEKDVDGFFVDNTDVYYNYPQESIYDGILTILDYMDHTGRKIMINGGDCFVKKYLTTEKNVLIDGVNQENVFTAYDFSKDVYTKNDQSTREYYTEYLDLAMSHGCTAYTLEYATDPTIRRQAAAYAGKHGYICYISDNIGLCLGR
mgnify:CR=1 FL=1